MLTLYTRTGCPYCARVITFLNENIIPWNDKNLAQPGVAEELLARGGKQQVPYLVDDATGTEMYESLDIIAYVQARYASDVPVVDMPELAVCPIV